MPTSFTKGDIFETEGIRTYAFGSNSDGTMDAGIASAMKKRWPELADAYYAACTGGKLALGDVFVWTSGEITVYALLIQSGSEKPRLSALTKAVMRMLDLASEAKIQRVGMPRIGASVGKTGLDWTRVRKMLGEVSVGRSVRIDVFEQFVRANRPVQERS